MLTLLVAGAFGAATAPLCASEKDDGIASSFGKTYAYRIYLKDDTIKTEFGDGAVTLTGRVNEPSHKYLAQETVACLPGVQRVDNRLEVKLEGAEQSDAWVQASVRGVLALHHKASGCKTEVNVRDGVVTLRGVATSQAQRELVTRFVEDVKGVLRVTNVMTVLEAETKADETAFEAIDDASVTAQVRVALRSHRSTSSANIKVGTTDGVVIVCGIAKNEAERTLVSTLASDISGVKSVVNDMTLAPAVSNRGVRPSSPQHFRIISASQ